MKKKKKKSVWGNSMLWINLRKWVCSYCGNPIIDNTPFSIILLNQNPEPYILCSQSCLRILIVKLDAQKRDRPFRNAKIVPP